MLSAAGFACVLAKDVTDTFVRCLRSEVGTLEALASRRSDAGPGSSTPAPGVVDDAEDRDWEAEDTFDGGAMMDYAILMSGWTSKLDRCAAGLQTWGLFQAIKPM